jgi:uncharacterized protein (DUF2147 family)
MSVSKLSLTALALVTALSLTACAGATKTGETKTTETKTAATTEQKTISIKQGLPGMKSAVVELRRALGSSDAAKAKAAFGEVHEAWEKFEDEVKAKDKTLYTNIETQLGVLKSGTQADKFDVTPLKKAVSELDALLYKVDPETAAAAIKSGAAEMIKEIAVLKEALAKSDAAKAQAQADKVFGVWWVFEHDVKAKDADLYEQVEEPLKAIQAGTKQSPLDTKTLNDLTAKLETLVNTLTK